MGLMDKIKKQGEQYDAGVGGNSDFFEFEKGLNRIRILTEPEVLATHFFGKGVPAHICYGKDKGCVYHGKDPNSKDGDDYKKPSIKLCAYVIDRQDENRVKLAELPLSLSYSLTDLEEDPDFQFDSYPMPFDVKIMYDPENDDPKAKYRMQPSPNKVLLTEEEGKDFAAKMERMTPDAYVEKRKRKQMQKDGMLPPDETVVAEEGVKYPDEGINPEDIPF